MEVDAGQVINVLIGLVVAGIGWWVNNIWGMVKSLLNQVAELNVKLAENYAPRVELQNTFQRIFDKLDEIQRDMRR